MIEKERIKILNKNKLQNNKFILYWMQASQRVEYNHALEYSIEMANKYKKPLIVFFGLTDNFLDANLRHYQFMLEGLLDVKKELEKKDIKFIIRKTSPELGVIDLAKQACIVITDRGYLNIQKKWRKYASEKIRCPFIQVESDVVIPIEVTSIKEEYSAATIRKKINLKLKDFLKPIKNKVAFKDSLDLKLDSIEISNINKVLSSLNIDRSVKPVEKFKGGTTEAKKHLNFFIKKRIYKYHIYKNDPNKDYISNLSPYLHFGQISPVYIALKCSEISGKGVSSFLEELIVRRELSMNYVYYNVDYDNFNGLPSWAKNSLKKHEMDKREYIYSIDEFEEAETHDPYWNAAEKQMLKFGKMHGYMRMYWGKKIIEWTKKPEDAFYIGVYLNNKYEMDGRDPNAYAGVAWCFGKHDRPWSERPIFGNVRYMNANGLRRKFDVESYSKKYCN